MHKQVILMYCDVPCITFNLNKGNVTKYKLLVPENQLPLIFHVVKGVKKALTSFLFQRGFLSQNANPYYYQAGDGWWVKCNDEDVNYATIVSMVNQNAWSA